MRDDKFALDRDVRFEIGAEVVLHPCLDSADHEDFKAHEGLEPGKKYQVNKAEIVDGYQQITINNGNTDVVLISGWFARA
ncbi:MAG TPA: hypothetical protein P5080_05715 [Candidatus Paceibacterota bacterium]|nr:hypothetical protein [Candidatus Pacearchaeota archaeon]HRZ51435.1 hypothetical protein [Candidatus Paceibacterota bacterium]HSA37164.1 hypothetical protein [Candidatus Paceibacterota bacterium]